MSYEDKLSEVQSLFQRHNSRLAEETAKTESVLLDFDQFKEALLMQGAHEESDLSALRYEDIASCLPDLPSGDKPMYLAKKIADIFRGEAHGVSSEEAEKMGLRELLQHYSPKRPNNPVGKRLEELSDGKPFLIFEDRENLDVEESLNQLKEIQEGYPPNDKVVGNGEPRKTYSVGDGPNRYAKENPIYPGRPLRPNGETCDQTGRSWEGVDKAVRQFIRLVVKDLDSITVDKAHDLIDLAMSEDALSNLKDRYPSVAVDYQQRKEKDNLPSLKVKLNRRKSGIEVNTFISGGEAVFDE